MLTWQKVASNIPAKIGKYTITNMPEEDTKVIIKISSSSNPLIFAQSLTFDYQSSGEYFYITSPTENEIINSDTYVTIAWKYGNFYNYYTNIKLHYSTDNGQNWLLIGSDYIGHSYFSWKAPIVDIETNFIIRISLANDNTKFSSKTIKIKPLQVFTFSNPNQFSMWRQGTAYNITWTSTQTKNVSIFYSILPDSLKWNVITSSFQSYSGTNNFNWTIPNSIAPNSKARIKIVDNSNNNIFAISETFTIVEPPKIVVTSPKEGDVLLRGQTYNITWDYPENTYFKIEYKPTSTTNWTTITTSTNLKNYSWTVPSSISSGTYQIRVSDYYNSNIFGLSGSFQISAKSLKITNPTANQQIKANTVLNIQWTASDINYIKCEFSSNDGVNWSTVFDNQVALANGSYQWTVPNINSTNCKLKLVDKDDSNINSLVSFSIYQPQVTFISPTAGAIWLSGTNKTIQWNSNNLQYVSIFYSIDNGTNWTLINNAVASPDNQQNSYTWTVPTINVTSNNCLIKLQDYYDTKTFFISPKFTIQKP